MFGQVNFVWLWIKLFVLNWLLVLMLVLLNSYLVLIFGWFYYCSVGQSDIGFLYLYCRYIFRWFCRFLFMLGRLCIIGILNCLSSFGLFMLECCRICGEVIVLVYSSIFLLVVVFDGIVFFFFSYLMFIVCLLVKIM